MAEVSGHGYKIHRDNDKLNARRKEVEPPRGLQLKQLRKKPNYGGNPQRQTGRRNGMTIGTILLIFLILALVGALPVWPHSKSWGYYPTSGLGLVVVVLLVFVLVGRF